MNSPIQFARQVSRQRLTTDESARELAPLLTPDERVIVGLLATAEIHDLDLRRLIDGYVDETGSTSAAEFSNLLQSKLHPLDVAKNVPRLLSQPCATALYSAHANGSLQSFYRSWLSQTVEDRINRVRHEDTHIAAFGRLGLRSLFCVYWIGFILLFITPEFQQMNEELGARTSQSMAALVEAGNIAFKVLPVLLLTIFFLLLYIMVFKRTILKNYLQRWLPGRWQQVILPRSILRRKLIAWDLQGFQTPTDSLGKNIDWDSYVSAKELNPKEASIMKAASSLETKSWLLRNMASNRLLARNTRFELLVRVIILTFQVVIAGFIILAALAIFSSLLEIMRGSA